MIENHMVLANWCDNTWECTCPTPPSGQEVGELEKCWGCIYGENDYFDEE